MCTVTYVPTKSGFILTSNRDEVPFRKTTHPQNKKNGDTDWCAPIDLQKGGSWIGMNNASQVYCLINGAFKKHDKQAHHTKSRGEILVNLVNNNKHTPRIFQRQNLTTSEPFTIIAYEDFRLYNLIWDGYKKHIIELNIEKPHIWSSVTLYNREQQKMRKHWFSQLLKNNSELTGKEMIKFHTTRHTSDNTVNIKMNRDGKIQTVSITQIELSNQVLTMNYYDLLAEKRICKELTLPQNIMALP